MGVCGASHEGYAETYFEAMNVNVMCVLFVSDGRSGGENP